MNNDSGDFEYFGIEVGLPKSKADPTITRWIGMGSIGFNIDEVYTRMEAYSEKYKHSNFRVVAYTKVVIMKHDPKNEVYYVA